MLIGASELIGVDSDSKPQILNLVEALNRHDQISFSYRGRRLFWTWMTVVGNYKRRFFVIHPVNSTRVVSGNYILVRWNLMKAMGRCRGDKDDLEKSSPGSLTKDSSIGLLRLLIVLIIFVVGLVTGLSLSSHNRYLGIRSENFYENYALAPMPATSYKNWEKEDCLGMNSFLRPMNLMEESPHPRVPKVAFMFLTRGPLPLLPLWERFFKGHEKKFSIYVHAPPGYKLNVSETSPFYAREIPSQNAEWGTILMADAERRLLANSLLDSSNERFVLLSESCIPVYNFPTVYKYLIGSAHSFVESYDDPSRYGRGRYNSWMHPSIELADWRKGSQWFEVNRTLATTIVSDYKYYNLFRKYCKPACYPDEHYIPTFLHKFYPTLNANRTVTYVDWSVLGPHPAAFEEANITEGFIQSIRNNGTLCSYNSGKTSTCYLFARKFAPSALGPLLNLTSSVMKF